MVQTHLQPHSKTIYSGSLAPPRGMNFNGKEGKEVGSAEAMARLDSSGYWQRPTLSVCVCHSVCIGYKPSHDWCKARHQGLLPMVGRDLRISLESYRAPQAGKPPDRKVLSRHGLLSSLGAWGLGTNQKAACN